MENQEDDVRGDASVGAKMEFSKEANVALSPLEAARSDLADALVQFPIPRYHGRERTLQEEYNQKEREHAQWLLAVLKEHPQLAKEPFPYRSWTRADHGMYPLWHAVFVQADLEIVRAIYELFPAALLDHGAYADCFPFPFHEAAGENRVEDGPVLKFLLQMKPSLLVQRDYHYNKTPLSIYVSQLRLSRYSAQRASSRLPHTVRAMLELHPPVSGNNKFVLGEPDTSALFRWILKTKVDAETMQYILGCPLLPARTGLLVASSNKVYNCCLSLDQIQALAILFPKWENIGFHCNISSDAFCYLLEALAKQKHDKTLYCSLMLPRLLPSSLPDDNNDNNPTQRFAKPLQELLGARSSVFKRLKFRRNCDATRREMDNAWFDMMMMTNRRDNNNQRLDELVLQQLKLKGRESLVQFLFSTNAPARLILENLEMAAPRKSSSLLQVHWTRPDTCRLTTLKIQLRQGSCLHTFDGMMEEVASLPSLVLLELSAYNLSKSMDVTRPLCHLLRCSRLKKLMVTDFRADAQVLSNAIATSQVETFHVAGTKLYGSWGATTSGTGSLCNLVVFAQKEPLEWWEGLLRMIPSIPSLSSVWVRQHSGVSGVAVSGSVTEAVRGVIANNGGLESLQISGLQVDLPDLCDALAANTRLKSLQIPKSVHTEKVIACLIQVLEHNNRTLEKVGMKAGALLHRKGSDQLLYLLDLNAFGRAKATDPATTRTEFIEMLCSLLSNKKVPSSCHCRKYPKIHIVYGLLRAVPSLWSES